MKLLFALMLSRPQHRQPAAIFAGLLITRRAKPSFASSNRTQAGQRSVAPSRTTDTSGAALLASLIGKTKGGYDGKN
jgi:hypothetical protein